MANEIEVTAGSGLTLYAVVRNPANRQMWSTTLNGGAGGFEAYVAANWPSYAIPLAEQDVTGDYAANFPTAIPAAIVPYSVDVRQRAGTTPSPSPSVDTRVTSFPVPWTGAAEASSAAMQPRLLTALPTVAAATAGGLPVLGASGGLLTQADITAVAAGATPGAPPSARPPTQTPLAPVTATAPAASGQLARGGGAQLSTTLLNTGTVAARGLLVEVTVYNPQGTPVYDSVVSVYSLPANVPETAAVGTWYPAASLAVGSYSSVVRVYAPRWGQLLGTSAASTFTLA